MEKEIKKELDEILNIKDNTDRKDRLKFYNIRLKAGCIANNRFRTDVKFIYDNCTPKSLDNGDFDKLCEILGFDIENTIDRNIKSVALSEIVKNKDNLTGAICDIVERIRDLNEINDQFNYNVLCLKILSIVCTKQDILNLYSCMLSKLDFGQIKAIQTQLNG